MPEQPSSRRIPLTRKAILDAAVARADSDGIEAVSMRTVAQALGLNIPDESTIRRAMLADREFR